MDVSGIMNDLLEKFAQPSIYERTVSPEELRNAATVMAKRGYLPTPESLRALEKYLQGYALWFTGDVGTGKTSFFKALPVQRFKGHDERRIVILNFGKLAGMTTDDLKDFLGEHRDDEIVFDDIGKEPIFNEYGSKFEVLPWLMEERLYVNPRTHYTSNYPKTYFDERYGYGLFDRMYSSAYLVTFAGTSRRELRPHVRFAPPAVPAAGTIPAGLHQPSENAPTSAISRPDDKTPTRTLPGPCRAVFGGPTGPGTVQNASSTAPDPSGTAGNVQKRPFQPSGAAGGTTTPPAQADATMQVFFL